jgi:ribosomal protein S18 acetylase RimI-like enzyme
LINIETITAQQLDILLHIAKKTFFDTYAHLSDPDDFNAYSNAAFNEEQLLSELNNPNSSFYFAMEDNARAGYLKLNYNDAQKAFQDKNAMELERLYVLNEYHNRKIGKLLLQFAIQTARDKNLKYIWLCVWDKNTTAIRFYERNNFKITGTHTFPFGDEKDGDLIMKLEL